MHAKQADLIEPTVLGLEGVPSKRFLQFSRP